MKRTTTVLCSLALSAAVLGGTATAAEANVHHRGDDHSNSRECHKHDSLGLTLLGIPLLGFFFPGKC
ncbi:hypothetical protein ACFY78_38855 [Streptomyces olindensis]|uniref:hypothetical protein n=1 Tax=Streptomyces olindensis TaxID=358823 RepID=UPI0033D4F7F5